MQMLMISFNRAISSEVMEILEKSGITGYTRWNQVQGKGKTSGSHFGTEVWPGENSVIFASAEDNQAETILLEVKDLRSRLGREGIKAFSWNLKAIT